MNPLSAILNRAAFAVIENTGWLKVTGEDRVRWLNGMVTNSIQALKPGEGNYSFLLNAQGRIQGDLTAFLQPDAVLLETGRPAEVAALLDKYIIMDDVELANLSTGRMGVLLAGPDSPGLLGAFGLPLPPSGWLEHGDINSAQVDVIGAYSPLIPRHEVWGPQPAIEAWIRTLEARGIPRANDAIEPLRLLEGTPRFGSDIRDRDLPQETSQTRALHFSKGCYLGQEIVERIRSRGQVHRLFSGFVFTGALPGPGTALESEGKPVGEVTSSGTVEHPAAGILHLGLGYLRREALDRQQPLTYPGGTARPILLPYTPK